MAQVDATVVTQSQLRKAILNIGQYARGCRKLSDFLGTIIPPSLTLTEERKLIEPIGDILDQHIFNSAKNYFDSEVPFQLEDIFISGSFSEGMHTINFEKKILSDTDFMLVLKNIKVTEEDQKEGNLTVKEDTPFVNLYLTDEDLIKTWKNFLDTPSQPWRNKNTTLSSMKLKERFREKYIKYGPIFMPLNQEDVETVDEGPSIAVNSELPGNGKITGNPATCFPEESFDFVLAIKCDGWPLCAQEWSSRPRRSPNQDIVEKIIKAGFHIVCKSSPEGNFRLSFYNAERILIQNLSMLQYKVYRAFKSLVRHYKNEWSSNIKKIFCSYHLKTIVLWYCEKTDSGDWNEDTLVCHLLSLLDELTMAVKKRFLPMYFMPKYNLMKQSEDGIDVAEKIAELRLSFPLITNAIISEEPTLDTWANYFRTHIVPGMPEFTQKCVEKGKFEQKDFVKYFETMENGWDEFWEKSVGEIPSRNVAVVERAKCVLSTPMMDLIDKCSELMNQHQNKNEETGKVAKNVLP